ncbi:MAG: ATP-binding protein [Acidobacteriota bacterium]
MLRNKVAFKLTTGYVAIVLISLLIVGMIFVNFFRNYAFTNKQNNMLERANEVAAITQNYMLKEIDRAQYDSFMNNIESFVGARVVVADTKGHILAQSGGRKCGLNGMGAGQCPMLDTDMISDILKGKNAVKEGPSNYYGQPVLAVGVPLYDKTHKIGGTVMLYTPVTGITEVIDKAFNLLMLAILVALVLTSLLSFYYSRFFTRPLQAMNQAALEMTKGNYSVRVDLGQDDEIGQLGDSIDLLASKLGYTIDQLFQEQNKLKDLIASMTEGILAFDRDFQLINYNEAVKVLMRESRNEAFEETVKGALARMGLIEVFQEVMETGENKAISIEWNNRMLKFILSSVRNNRNEIIGVVALVLDISESERLEQMRKDFVANVSHELRTPLTLIRGSAEALIDGAVSSEDDIKRYHERILNETKGLERLVSDLLDLTQIQSGKIQVSLDQVDIVSLVKDAARSMQDIASKKRITIETSVGHKIGPIRGDYGRLRQLMIIILDNALKFAPESSTVTVAMDAGDYIYIRVKDNGPGIPYKDLPFIWDRFYKADKSRQPTAGGTGLGLSIARSIVELHHGVIQIESLEGEGTTVIVGLPFLNMEVEQ